MYIANVACFFLQLIVYIKI